MKLFLTSCIESTNNICLDYMYNREEYEKIPFLRTHFHHSDILSVYFNHASHGVVRDGQCINVLRVLITNKNRVQHKPYIQLG